MPLLRDAITRTGVHSGTFVDYFAGSGVVSRLAKWLGFRVIANDWEPYTRVINGAYIACNHTPAFAALGGPTAAFDMLNQLLPIDGYISCHLCPRNDRSYDPAVERLFFTRQNGGRIDAMREQIDAWGREGRLSEGEYAFLLAPLLYGASYVSNTSGVFKGFHRGWGGATGTALYRILSEIHLTPPRIIDNGQVNRVTTLDAIELAEQLGEFGSDGMVAYLDPPYNQHPYGANYHVLNTIALWDCPPLSPTITGLGDKSAIRKDWRTERRSAYNYRAEALPALERLLRAVRSRFILVSYSTDGLIQLPALIDLACHRGKTEVLTRRYKRYRVSSQRSSPAGYNVEFVLIIDGTRPSDPPDAESLIAQICGELGARGNDSG